MLGYTFFLLPLSIDWAHSHLYIYRYVVCLAETVELHRNALLLEWMDLFVKHIDRKNFVCTQIVSLKVFLQISNVEVIRGFFLFLFFLRSTVYFYSTLSRKWLFEWNRIILHLILLFRKEKSNSCIYLV